MSNIENKDHQHFIENGTYGFALVDGIEMSIYDKLYC